MTKETELDNFQRIFVRKVNTLVNEIMMFGNDSMKNLQNLI